MEEQNSESVSEKGGVNKQNLDIKAEKKRGSKKLIFFAVAIGILLISASIYFVLNKTKGNCNVGICDVPITANAVANTKDSAVVAEINNEKVYEKDLQKELDLALFLRGIPDSYRSQISESMMLNQTIIKTLLYQDAVKEGYSITKADSLKLFEDALTKNGMTIDDFKTAIQNKSFDYDYLIESNRKTRVVSKFVNDTLFKSISLAKDEALQYYNENMDLFKVDTRIRLSQIFVNTSKDADEVIKELDSGKDFAELAKEKSLGESASKGGDLGYLTKGMMIPEFEDVAFNLTNIGDYNKVPIKSKYGYHILKLTAREEARQKSFEEVKADLENALLLKKQNEKLKEYINTLYQNANIKIYLDETKQTPIQTPIAAPSKSDKPKVELFVMSYCPYGTQIEKGIIPVVEQLGDHIDFKIKFVNYAMHGKQEIEENTRQYCIQKQDKHQFIGYLKCFLDAGDSAGCLKKLNIDEGQLASCISETDTTFKISANYNDKSTWLGNFPPYNVNKEDAQKYQVEGSPTLVINGETVNTNRDAASLMQSLCSAFNKAPDVCTMKFSTTQPSPGFGFSQNSTSAAGNSGA